MNTVEKAMYWVNRIESPVLQVYPDAGNITDAAVEVGKNVLDDVETGCCYLAAVHLKETGLGVFREVSYGTGYVDYSSVITRPVSLDVRRYLAEF